MPGRTYVCTHCRTSRRAEAAYGRNTELRCSVCGGPLWELEWRWRIPRKTDDKGWRELEAKIASDAKRLVPRRQQIGRVKITTLDRQIDAVSRQKTSTAKAKKLKKLQHERAQAIHDYV
jgi:hypothetical protein